MDPSQQQSHQYYQPQQPQQLQQPNPAYYQSPQEMSAEKPGPTPMGSEQNLKSHHQSTKYGSKWLFGFWDCCSPLSTCCLGCWCPCVLFGKTYDREHGKGETSGLGAMCCAWYCASQFCFGSCLQCIMRGQQRERHGIEGNAFGDFCGALCCPCCGLVQEEKESIVRVSGLDPKTKVAYQPINQNMTYPA